ncbi:uncharacterized protein n4bp2l2 isoform 2-T2 [Aulostomus maculatus]
MSQTENSTVGESFKNNDVECEENNAKSARERVLKQVGLTSTAFIGPAFPPKTDTAETDIEDKLSEFYKELEQIHSDNDTKVNNQEKSDHFQPPVPPKAPVEIQDASRPADAYQKQGGPKRQSRSHWYQNEPYHHRRPRTGNGVNQRYSSPPRRRPPHRTFHRPPFHGPPLPHPQNAPPHMDPNWRHPGMMDHHQDHSHFQPFPHFPPRTDFPARGYYEDAPHYFDWDEYDYETQAENFEWSRDSREDWPHSCEDYDDTHQHFDSRTELWQQHHCPLLDQTPHPPLVLILMRGLPGSGKSTMARELLSTDPNGLILSTDDFFAYQDGYCYEAGQLGAAHEWNQRRAKDAMYDGRSPIIIDNTNIQAWEMKPYVQMALERGYQVDFCEPNTSWKFDP